MDLINMELYKEWKCSVANAVSPVLGRRNELDSFRSQVSYPISPPKKASNFS